MIGDDGQFGIVRFPSSKEYYYHLIDDRIPPECILMFPISLVLHEEAKENYGFH